MDFRDLPDDTVGHILNLLNEDEYQPTRYVERRWKAHRRQCTEEFIYSAYNVDVLENELIDSIRRRQQPVFIIKTVLGNGRYDQDDEDETTKDYQASLTVFFPNDLSVVTLTQKSEIYIINTPTTTAVVVGDDTRHSR